MSGGLMSGGRMSGGRLSGGRMSGGRLSGGLKSYDRFYLHQSDAVSYLQCSSYGS